MFTRPSMLILGNIQANLSFASLPILKKSCSCLPGLDQCWPFASYNFELIALFFKTSRAISLSLFTGANHSFCNKAKSALSVLGCSLFGEWKRAIAKEQKSKRAKGRIALRRSYCKERKNELLFSLFSAKSKLVAFFGLQKRARAKERVPNISPDNHAQCTYSCFLTFTTYSMSK